MNFRKDTLVLFFFVALTTLCCNKKKLFTLHATNETSLSGRAAKEQNLRKPVASYDERHLQAETQRSSNVFDSVKKLYNLFTDDDGDLNIRFNKITYPEGIPSSLKLPLTKKDYPISEKTAEILRTQSLADGVVLPSDYDMHGARPARYVRQLGGPPTYPSSNPNNTFWGELEAVVDDQILRRASGAPPFTLPALWTNFSIHDVAKAVYNEYPGKHQADMLKKFFKEGLAVDYTVLPFRSRRDIVSLQFRFAYFNTWAIERVGAINFCIKWTYGRPRPEEVAYQIATGKITKGVPEGLKTKILSMNLENATVFTAFVEGSPSHPAWPAMHSAASSSSFWLSVVANLTPAQYCEALRVDYAVAYARTVAGVHYPDDNIMGLNLGQAILAESMPLHFFERYGSNPAAVRRKIARMRFNWNDFNPEDCSIKGVPIVA
jgi:membrane-associated phospholipid phosphatase